MRRAEAAVADSVTVDGHEVKGLKVELRFCGLPVVKCIRRVHLHHAASPPE